MLFGPRWLVESGKLGDGRERTKRDKKKRRSEFEDKRGIDCEIERESGANGRGVKEGMDTVDEGGNLLISKLSIININLIISKFPIIN